MMRKFPFIAAAWIIMATSAAMGAVPATSDYRSIVPNDWTLLPSHPDSEERRFVSPARDAWLSLNVSPADRDSIRAQMDAARAVPGARITYERQGQGWIVVSGYKGDRIFYRRAMLACGNRKWHLLEFEYPAVQKRAFDRFVTRASYALKAYEHVGCNH